MFLDLVLFIEELVCFFIFFFELFGLFNVILDFEGYIFFEFLCFELYFSIFEYFVCFGVLDYLGFDVKNVGIIEIIDFYLIIIVLMYRKY